MCICFFGMWSIPFYEVDEPTIALNIFFVKKNTHNWVFFYIIFYYTLIFFTISPYRSFLIVIFLLLRSNPTIIRINPYNQKRLSAGRVNGVEIGSTFPRSARFRLPVFSTTAGVFGIMSLSSITNNERTIIVTPIPKIVHFHIFLRNTPGSNIPRMTPIRGKT